MAARIGKPATHISGVLAFLTDLRYIRREIPYGESLRSTKKTLYKIDDPFLNFWFTFIVAEKSRIDLGLASQSMGRIKKRLPSFVASEWEELCRQSVPFLDADKEFSPATRWWGRGIDGTPMEIDVLAGSGDGKILLAGECKWTEKVDINRLSGEFAKKIANLPFAKGHKIMPVLFLKNKPVRFPAGLLIFGPEDVVAALK